MNADEKLLWAAKHLMAKIDVPRQQPDPLTCTFRAVWGDGEEVEHLEFTVSRRELQAMWLALSDLTEPKP